MDANRTCQSVCITDLGVLIKQAVMVYIFTDTCFIDTKAKAYNFFQEQTEETLALSNSFALKFQFAHCFKS